MSALSLVSKKKIVSAPSTCGTILEASRVCGDKAAVARGDDINKRVDRAEALVHWESCLLPGRHWKEQNWPQPTDVGHSEGPIKEAKGDESAYPPRTGPSQPTISIQSGRVSVLSQFEICEKRGCRRPVRDDRRAPSLLDHTKDARMFFQVAERLARAQVPPSA